MTFCCEKFKYNYDLGIVDEYEISRELFPNIKIVKIQEDDSNKGYILYRYVLVSGPVNQKPPFVLMVYCPFCGTNLPEFYNDDQYN